MHEIKKAVLLKGLQYAASLTSGIGRSKKLFILIYHRVLVSPDFMRSGEADIEAFNWQMELLATYFNVLPLDVALEKLQTNQLPGRAVCITFDDGYADNLKNAVPILKKYGLPATFFIATGFLNGGRMWNDSIIEAIRIMPETKLDLTAINLGKFELDTQLKKAAASEAIIKQLKHLQPQQRKLTTEHIISLAEDLPNDLMLTNDQLLELHHHGMEIGGHTVTHPILAKLDVDSARKEIADNKIALETILDQKLRFFAYPNGKPGQDYLPEHTEILKDMGYQAALSTQWGVANQSSDFWQLPRFTPWDQDPLKFMGRMMLMYNKIQ